MIDDRFPWLRSTDYDLPSARHCLLIFAFCLIHSPTDGLLSGLRIGAQPRLLSTWGPDYGEELEYLRVFMNRMRKKIEPDPARARFLLTNAWASYRFCLA